MLKNEERLFNPLIVFGAIGVVVIGVAAGLWLALSGGNSPHKLNQPAIEVVHATPTGEIQAEATPTAAVAEMLALATTTQRVVAGEPEIKGYVVRWPDRIPVADIPVVARNLASPEQVRQLTSDSQGQFTIEDLVPGQWQLLAQHPDYARYVTTEHAPVIELASGQQVHEVMLHLVAPDSLSGKVRTQTGAGLTDVNLTVVGSRSLQYHAMDLVEPEPGQVARVTSATDGSFLLSQLQPGYFDVLVQSPGYVETLFTGLLAGTKPHDLRLVPESILSGTVTWQSNQQLAAGAVVHLEMTDPALQHHTGDYPVDASGHYRIEALPDLFQAELWATHGEHQSGVHRITFVGRQTEHLHNLSIPQERRISGQLAAFGSGQALAQIEVWAGTDTRTLAQQTTSDPNGRFEVATPSAGLWLQFRSNQTYPVSPQWVEFKDDQPTLALPTTHLHPVYSITGRVLNAEGEQGLPDVTVTAYPLSHDPINPGAYPSATTDHAGVFHLKRIPGSEYRLLPSFDGMQPCRSNGEPLSATDSLVLITRQIEDPASGPVLYLKPLKRQVVKGLVQTAGGAMISGCEVKLVTVYPEPQVQAQMTTGDDGRFEFPGIVGGAYQIVAEHPSYWPRAEHCLPTQKTREWVLELSPRKPNNLRGIVRDAQINSQPLAGATVLVLSGRVEKLCSEGWLDYHSFSLADLDLLRNPPTAVVGSTAAYAATTAVDGTFNIANLAMDYYTVCVFDPERTRSSYAFNVMPNEFQEITLNAGQTIEGQVLRPDGQMPCTQFDLTLAYRDADISLKENILERTGTFSSPQGRFRIEGLPQGFYTISINGPQSTEAHFGIELLGESVPSQEVILNRGNRLQGRVVDVTGKPLANATVALEEVVKTTRSDGTFEYRGLPDGHYWFGIWATGYSPHFQTISLESGNEIDLGDCRLDQRNVVVGQVTNSDQAGVAGLVVKYPPEIPGFLQSLFQTKTSSITDPAGFFYLDRVSSGECLICLDHSATIQQLPFGLSGGRQQSQNITVLPNQTNQVKFELDTGVRINGRISYGTEPISGTTVALIPMGQGPFREYLAATNELGVFSIEGVPGGTYRQVVGYFSPWDDTIFIREVRIPSQNEYNLDWDLK